MNDTVSELTEDDWQVLLSAVENLRGGGSVPHDTDTRWRIASSLADIAERLRAYLAATKPPLAGDDLAVRLQKTADAVDLLDSGSRYTLSMRSATKAILIEAAAALASPPMPGRGEGFVLVPVELTDEMILARWPSYHPWGQNAPPPEDRPSMYAEMVEKTKALWAILLASRPKEDTHAK